MCIIVRSFYQFVVLESSLRPKLIRTQNGWFSGVYITSYSFLWFSHEIVIFLGQFPLWTKNCPQTTFCPSFWLWSRYTKKTTFLNEVLLRIKITEYFGFGAFRWIPPTVIFEYKGNEFSSETQWTKSNFLHQKLYSLKNGLVVDKI